MENKFNVTLALCNKCKCYEIALFNKTSSNAEEFKNAFDYHQMHLEDWVTIDPSFYEFKKSIKSNLEDFIVPYEDFQKNCFCHCQCDSVCTKINTFKDACDYLSLPDIVPDYSFLPEGLEKRMIAQYKLMIITAALNGTFDPIKEPNEPRSQFTNHLEYPVYFEDLESPFPYSHSWGSDDGNTNPGLYLSFKNGGHATYAGVQFREMYIDLYKKIIDK